MKWLFLSLLALNALIFVLQNKGDNVQIANHTYQVSDGAENIKLLSELNQSINSEEGRCVVIGEIKEDVNLSRLKDILDEKSVEYEVINKKDALAPSFWVFAKDGQNDSLIENLKVKGIDSYKVTSGEWEGNISLGLFANVDLANNLIRSLKNKNIDAYYVEHKKYKKSNWVSFPVSQVGQLDALKKEIDSIKINVGEIKEFFCKSVASEK